MNYSACLKTEEHDHTILGVCVRGLPGEELDRMECVYHADSGREALELLRLIRVDLIVAGLRLPDVPLWDLMDRVKVLWPWQKWVLVDSALTLADEREARIRGALRVIESCRVSIPELCRLASQVRARSHRPALATGVGS